MRQLLIKGLRGLGVLAVVLVLVSYTLAMLQAAVLRPPDLTGSRVSLLIAIGLGVGVVFFALASRWNWLYIFGHELTHWLAAKAFLRRTSGFRSSAEGGSVTVENPNIWITLAPYFVPLHALVWVGLYALLRIWYAAAWLDLLFWSGLGFWYAFHLVMTVLAIRQGQQDLKQVGVVLSLALILALNLSLLYWGMALLDGRPKTALRDLGNAWHSQGRVFHRLIQTLT